MKCQEVMEYMQRQLDLDLDEAEQRLLQQHIDICGTCQQMMSRLQSLADNLYRLPAVHPPISLVDAILPKLDAIDREANIRKRKRTQISYRIWGGVAAASLLIGIAVLNGIFGASPQQSASDNMAVSNMESFQDATAANQSAFDRPDEHIVLKTKGAEGYLTSQSDHATADDGLTSNELAPDKNVQGAIIAEAPSQAESLNTIDSFSPADNGDNSGEAIAVSPDASGGLAFDFPSSLAVTPGLGSPDGHYSAYVENNSIVILATLNNERIFTSTTFEADEIYGLHWSEDSEKLYFQLVNGDSETTQYVDVGSGTVIQP